MRQIKFRGKPKAGYNYGKDWLYGSLLQIDDSNYGIIELSDVSCDENGYVDYSHTPIQLETIGQFTGLTDKNGKEIYDGDILEYDTGKRYVVVYSIEAFDSGTNEHYIGAYMLRDDHNFHELICNVTRPYKYAEIIGNIHDHQELLTK